MGNVTKRCVNGYIYTVITAQTFTKIHAFSQHWSVVPLEMFPHYVPTASMHNKHKTCTRLRGFDIRVILFLISPMRLRLLAISHFPSGVPP